MHTTCRKTKDLPQDKNGFKNNPTFYGVYRAPIGTFDLFCSTFSNPNKDILHKTYVHHTLSLTPMIKSSGELAISLLLLTRIGL